jgi:hypothetical protein
MPINQSHELQGAYEHNDLKADLHVIHGAAHGGEQFYDSVRIDLVDRFLKKHLSTK